MKMPTFLMFVLLLISATSYSQSGVEARTTPDTITRSQEVCALHISYADLSTLIRRTEGYFLKTVGVDQKQDVNARLQLSDGIHEYEIRERFDELTFSRVPLRATEASFSVSRIGSGPLSDVRITLQDRLRQVSVVGNDRQHIDGLVLLVAEQVAQIGCVWGGSDFRLNVMFICLGISIALVFVLCSPLAGRFRYHAVGLIAPGMILVFGYMVPIIGWPIGLVVSDQPVSFTADYFPYISLVIALALTALLSFWAGKKKEQGDPTAAAENEAASGPSETTDTPSTHDD